MADEITFCVYYKVQIFLEKSELEERSIEESIDESVYANGSFGKKDGIPGVSLWKSFRVNLYVKVLEGRLKLK